MIVYETQGKTCCYIHIPKCCGKYIGKKIMKNYKCIKKYWGDGIKSKKIYKVNSFVDRAHIPVDMFLNHFYMKGDITEFATYTRNPYNRLISAYLYCSRIRRKTRDEKKHAQKFKSFVKTKLANSDFGKYNYPHHNRLGGGGVHFARQCLYLRTDFCKKLNFKIKINKLETIDKNEPMWSDFNLREYDLDLYYDAESFEIVNTLYNEDFIKLKYEKKL